MGVLLSAFPPESSIEFCCCHGSSSSSSHSINKSASMFLKYKTFVELNIWTVNRWNSKHAFAFRLRLKNIIMLLLPMAFSKISQEIFVFSFILDRWVTCLKWRPSQYSPGSDSIQLRPVSTSRLAFTQPPHPANYINKKRVSKPHFVFTYICRTISNICWIKMGLISSAQPYHFWKALNILCKYAQCGFNWKGLRGK